MSKILLANGRYFDLLNPVVYPSDIDAIAHALAHTCRFAGHTREFYSVAQHSVLVASLMPPGLELIGLLHDAAEAFVGDVSTPLKELLPEYKVIEANVQAAVWRAFIPWVPFGRELEVLRDADLIALATEKRDLMRESDGVWPVLRGVTPLAPRTEAWTAKDAKAEFLVRFRELTYSIEPPEPDDRQKLLDHIEELQQQIAGYQAEVALLKAPLLKPGRVTWIDDAIGPHEPTTR